MIFNFSIKCLAKDLKDELLQVELKQAQAELYWQKMKFDKQYEKTMQSAVMAKYAVKQLLN